MDTPPPPSTAVSSPTKLRLMCSYGGHIFPRPQTKSLHYLGGETRIISIPIAATTISGFISEISAALHHHHNSLPFYLKYQLPHHDLDSLISLSTDEDLHVMMEEYQRLTTHGSSRIRVFLFTANHSHRLEPVYGEEKVNSSMAMLKHPKTEAWFVDALKSARMMEEARSEGESMSGGGGGLYTQESMVLDTSSSFGSTASSSSLTNLPAAKVGNLEENVGSLPCTDSFASDNSSVTHPQIGNYQDPTIPYTLVENKASPISFESESNFSDSSSGVVQICKPVQFSGYPLIPQVNHQQQQPLQFVQMGPGPNYITQNPTGFMPVTSYYATYDNTMPHQQLHYQSNHPYPVYIVQAPQHQTYNIPTQYGLVDPVNIAPPLRPPVHPSATLLSHRVYKEVAPVIESTAQVYRSTAIPYNENQQSSVMHHHQSQPTMSNELDEDTARAQIYKSQPPPPVVVPSQNQTMTKATAVLLSEAMAQLHVDNVKQ